jgi:signal peptidase II
MKSVSLSKSFYISLTTVLVIFILDRITKLYVIYESDKLLTNELFISKYLNITLIWNNGIAFGFFSLDQGNLYNILTAIISIITIIILIMIINSKGIKKYALLIILGGALGNLFDRVTYKAVPDFIDFHAEEFHWFIFNVADIFITIGVIFMVLIELSSNNKQTNDKI